MSAVAANWLGDQHAPDHTVGMGVPDRGQGQVAEPRWAIGVAVDVAGKIDAAVVLGKGLREVRLLRAGERTEHRGDGVGLLLPKGAPPLGVVESPQFEGRIGAIGQGPQPAIGHGAKTANAGRHTNTAVRLHGIDKLLIGTLKVTQGSLGGNARFGAWVRVPALRCREAECLSVAVGDESPETDHLIDPPAESEQLPRFLAEQVDGGRATLEVKRSCRSNLLGASASLLGTKSV